MMRRRSLALVGAATVAGLVVARSRRRRTDAPPPRAEPSAKYQAMVHHMNRRHRMLTLFLAPLATLVFAFGWPWDEAIDGISGILDQAREMIRKAVQSVVDWTWGYLVHIYNVIGDLIGNVVTFILSTTLALARLGIRIAETAVHVIETAANYARGLVYDAVVWVGQQINNLGGWVYGLILGVLDEITKLGVWVLENVFGPLYQLFLSAVRWVEQTIVPAIMDAVGWVIGNVWDVVESLLGKVDALWDFVFGTLRNVWLILEPYWDTIYGLATDPGRVFSEMVEPYRLYGGRMIMEAVTNGLANYGSVFEDWFEKWAT